MRRNPLREAPVRAHGRHRFHRLLAAWLGVVALLIHGLIPLGQAVSYPGAPDGETDPFRALVICAAYGVQSRAPAGETPTNKVPTGPRSDGSSCPICQIQSLGKVLSTTAAISIPAPLIAGHVLPHAPETDTAVRWFPGTGQPRAPPAVV